MPNTELFIRLLFAWYKSHKRDLPWRKNRSAYTTWISEIMLQQTRVAQALPYYQKFIQILPTVHHLAQAKEDVVMRLWQGLGYYTRARNLHATAKSIVLDHKGIFPTTYDALLRLKGIGPYTAAAIASMVFDQSVAVVDGNVYRVLSRVFGIERDVSLGQNKRFFHALATKLVPSHAPGDYNEALMEFGALQCTPQTPKCLLCPLRTHCVAFAKGIQHKLPVKSRKIKIKKRFFHYIVVRFQGVLYVRKRTQKDIWRGLYDFYLIESAKGFKYTSRDPLWALLHQYGYTLPSPQHVYQHQLTHQRLYVCFSDIEVNQDFLSASADLFKKSRLTPVQLTDFKALPKPALITKFLTILNEK